MREYIIPQWPAPPNVRAMCTTRFGGVSNAPYDSFNLADHVGDDKTSVKKNRELFRNDLELTDEPFWMHQMHSTVVVNTADHERFVDADGATSHQTARPCVVMAGDCLPILLCDQDGTNVAALHGGWRGLANGIVANGVNAMNCDSSNLMAWLGPAIGPDAFEVGPEVFEQFVQLDAQLKSAFRPKNDGKYMANIFEIARILLSNIGVTHIYSEELCTISDKRFYSYRRDQGQTGRMASIIWIQ